MQTENINKKIINGTKWSFLGEVSAKIMMPITNIILARLLTPNEFGLVTTIVMIISFADLIGDAGFQKYLVQCQFKSDIEKNRSTAVAFWTNMILAFILWGLIIVFRNELASLVGNPGFGNVVAIAGISIPLTAISSIQTALFKRDFDFKSLFYARLIGVCVPIAVTIPLAFIFNNYWSLIIGTIATNLANAIILTMRSTWKPYFYYDFSVLKNMFSFSCWSLIEQITIWITLYAGTFIISSYLNLYYLGLYKNGMGMVNQIIALISGATMPIIFSALSRFQDDKISYIKIVTKFQRLVSVFVFPLGMGIFIYRDFITNLLLGSQWAEVSNFIGLWAMMSSLSIVFSDLFSEVYRSLGKPKLSVLSQILYLVILIPTLLITAQISFQSLYIARSLIIIPAIVIDWIIIWFTIKISPIKMLTNVFPTIISSLLMGFFGIWLIDLSSNFIWHILSIFICIIFYFIVIMFFPITKRDLISLIPIFSEKLHKGIPADKVEQNAVVK